MLPFKSGFKGLGVCAQDDAIGTTPASPANKDPCSALRRLSM
jgi:hypothetical protein